jgi:hypothetical protein
MISQNATQYKYSIHILLKSERIVKEYKKIEEESNWLCDGFYFNLLNDVK